MSRARAKDAPGESPCDSPPELVTRQRIFQRDKKRFAIRLEEGFWTQLEDCAREEGRRLSDFLFEAIGNPGKGENRTAQLRLFCLQWLRQRLAHARHSAGNLDIQSVLSACPSPCVIMTKEKAIVAYNTAFARNIVSRLSPEEPPADGGKAAPAPLTFKLETPLEDIHADLLQGKARQSETPAAFVRRGKAIRVLARFCLLESDKGPNTPLLCFLIAG